MESQCEVEVCGNPVCRRPLNRYAFSANNGSKQLYCTASCFNDFKREVRWTQRMTSAFSVLAPLRASFFEDGHDQRQERTNAQTEAPATTLTVTAASAVIVIATIASFL
jgi:hypothetical protein